MKTLFTFCWLFAFCIGSITTVNAQVNKQDSLALVDLYNSTNGSEWKNNSKWLKGPIKKWYGIYLTADGKGVSQISLNENNLTGSLPSSLGNLSNLTHLGLSNNQLSGSIPPELGKLTILYYLMLNNNQLNGKIPPELGNISFYSFYSELNLSNNQLSGPIPPEFGNFSNLYVLNLEHNQLSGGIPAKLGNLSFDPNRVYVNAHTKLNLSNNQLSGSIPPEFGNIKYLDWLFLSGNQLSGNIPPELGNLHLIRLDLSNNQLSGPIPPNLGVSETLLLNDNQLSGTIPPELGNISFNDNCSCGLDLSYNQLSGTIPPELGNSAAFYMNLSYNQLSGIIPPELENLFKNFEGYASVYLDLSHNQLSGNIPPELGGSYSFLNLSDNQLSGNIPGALLSYYFSHVRLSYNKLEGPIPIITASSYLNELFADHNKLSGAVNSSIANLINLDSLEISNNRLTFDGLELVAQIFPFAKYNRQALIPTFINDNTLSVSAGGTLSNNVYQWYKLGEPGNTTITADSVFHPTESGVYFVKVRNKVVKSLNLVSKPIKYTAPLNTIAINEQQEFLNNSFSVYPNPAKNVLHVTGNSNASFSLMHEDGKILLKQNIDKTGIIDISNLAAGVYYLKNNNTNALKKIAVIK